MYNDHRHYNYYRQIEKMHKLRDEIEADIRMLNPSIFKYFILNKS
jgi:hypothetical protein